MGPHESWTPRHAPVCFSRVVPVIADGRDVARVLHSTKYLARAVLLRPKRDADTATQEVHGSRGDAGDAEAHGLDFGRA